MEKIFEKFKRKIILEVFLKCLIISSSLGILSFSIPYLIIKLSKIKFNVLYLIIIGLGVFFALFTVLFLILKPNDKKAAKKIDNRLGLAEKVQTMIEFKDEEGLIINKQRENTNNILKSISLKRLTMRFSAILFVIFGLSITVCITAISIPKEEEIVIIDPDYNVDDWTLIALKDLIKYVEESSLQEDLKTYDIEKLNTLVEQIKQSDKESEMKTAVLTVIEDITLKLDIINTNNEIFEVLKVSNYALVTTLAFKINDLDIDAINNAIDGFITTIGGSSEAITFLDIEFGQLLKASNINKEDELYRVLVDFNDKLLVTKNSSDIFTEVCNVVSLEKEKILNSAVNQKMNESITNYIISQLRYIFSLYEDDPNNNTGEGSQDVTHEKPEKPENNTPPQDGDFSGGYGTGEIIFGSDDSFFDPEKGKVEFSDVISKYQNDILGRLEEGKIPEELKEYFEYYYDILFGIKEDEE